MTSGTPDAAYSRDDYHVIARSVYLDKTTAGFVSQLVGMLSGYEYVRLANGRCCVAMPDEWFALCNGPYAGNDQHTFQTDKLLENGETGFLEVWIDDDFSVDIFNQYSIERMYAEYGTFVSKVISDGWMDYGIWDMGGGQRKAGAYGLISRNGYLPQFAGSGEFGNWYSFLPEPYIATDTLGISAAAMPRTAATQAKKFAAVTGDRDNVEWAQMFATMLSLAYVETDVETLIRTAADVLAPDGFASSVVEEVFALHERYPSDWRRAYTEFENKYYVQDVTLAGSTTINCAFTLLDLLYGGGDYVKTAQIGALAGYDCETTCGIALSVLAIMGGTAVMPEEADRLVWQGGNGVIVNRARSSFAEDVYMHADNLPERMPIPEVIDLFVRNFESILTAEGGHMDANYYYIPKQSVAKHRAITLPNGGLESGSTDGFSVSGHAEISDLATTGLHAAKLIGETELCTTAYGLTEGKTYALSAFIRVTDKSTAYLFARDKGKTFSAAVYRSEGAAAYESQKAIARTLVFTATGSEMDLGVRFIPNAAYDGEFAVVDAFTLHEVRETKAGDVTVRAPSADGLYNGKLSLSINAEAYGEACLKISFANHAPVYTNAAITVNGKSGGTAAFSATGAPLADLTPQDCVYIPVLLQAGENEVTLSFAERELLVREVRLVQPEEAW